MRSLKATLEHAPHSIQADALDGIALGSRLETNLETIQTLIGDPPDLTIRRLRIGGAAPATVVFYSTLVQNELVSLEVIKPLTYDAFQGHGPASQSLAALEGEIRERIVNTAALESCSSLKEVIQGLSHGKVALLIDGSPNALLIDLVGYEKRAVMEPLSEPVVRGPLEGLTENLQTNLSLIRRRIGSPLLRFESRTVGRWTRTRVAIAYIHGMAGDSLVSEVRRRIEEIDIDGIIDSSYIEELIEDTPYTVFPQVLNTERPDVVVAGLLEGRVAILSDGSPFALIVPTTLWALMSSSEDYYQRWDGASLIRMLRYLLTTLVVLLPSTYVAATTFHPEMLPGPMLISIAAARESVPFSSFTEVLLMEIVFEALREAGLRLPRPIGQTVGIVGAIVIGEAAVQAQLVSAPVVIIVAFTGISSFVIPHFNLSIALRIIRFPILVLAGTFGLLGISAGLLLIILHLTTLYSFGQPYLAPISPLSVGDLRDTIIRAPRWRMFRRPHLTGVSPTWREDFPLMPHPSKDDRGEASRNAPEQH